MLVLETEAVAWPVPPNTREKKKKKALKTSRFPPSRNRHNDDTTTQPTQPTSAPGARSPPRPGPGTMSGALAGRTINHELEKGRVEPTKVRRYWPGRAPEWALNEDDEVVLQQQRRDSVAAPVVVSKADPRLRRLAEASAAKAEDGEPWHRRVKPRLEGSSDEEGSGEGEEEEEEEEEEEDLAVDEVTLLDRRAAMRQRLLQIRQEEEDQLPQQEEDIEEEEGDDESEYETDSEDERFGRKLIKPVFVPKTERETIAERDRVQQEEELRWKREQQEIEERKIESKALVLELIRQEDSAAKSQADGPKSANDVDTDDDKEEEKEFETWKIREYARLKRDRDERELDQKMAAERAELNAMTEEQRRAWDRANPKVLKKAPKKKWKYLQKYWHKGAFFQDTPDDPMGTTKADDIFMRDFSAPTGEDLFDKTSMPKVMQVKSFGRSGRTKWTHLVNEDTTNFDDPFLGAVNDAQRMQYNKKRAAMGQEFTAPKKFRR
ncbi:unnamed protein product [Ostreobium quekettii]|uniref:Micro-fibrillar-associated protein 1 C-terminal domain-containing protein n=1 Tax=Ostreobium quekettii TaxID=121088 RepID=A0A8S1J269_9CHLO|nr:unnamed protein product [Ostreobium quekettii]